MSRLQYGIGIYPSQSKLKTLFSYKNGYLYPNPSTKWLENRKYKVGRIGTFDKHHPNKPSRVQIYGKHYFVHRLIWIYFNGSITQEDIISFIDNNPQNCKIKNLKKISSEERLDKSKIHDLKDFRHESKIKEKSNA